MTRALILGDLHLDKAFPHTLPDTKSASDWLKYKLSTIRDELSTTKSVIQLGDVFDTHDASGYYLVEAQKMFRGLDVTFPLGNHDVSYRSLPSNSKLLRDVLQFPETLAASVQVVDHCLTQTLFEETISMLLNSGQGDVLVLHCNVGEPRASHENWLTESKLSSLANQYKFVFIGHEHKFKQVRDNVWFVGSPYPTNFGEMHDHFVGYLSDGVVTFKRTFDAGTQYLELDIQTLLDDSEFTVPTSVLFVNLVGSVKVEDGGKAYRWLKKLRELPHVIAVKGDFSILPNEADLVLGSNRKFKDFPSLLAEALSDLDLKFLDEMLTNG